MRSEAVLPRRGAPRRRPGEESGLRGADILSADLGCSLVFLRLPRAVVAELELAGPGPAWRIRRSALDWAACAGPHVARDGDLAGIGVAFETQMRQHVPLI